MPTQQKPNQVATSTPHLPSLTQLSRRQFMKTTVPAIGGITTPNTARGLWSANDIDALVSASAYGKDGAWADRKSYEQYLRESVIPQNMIDHFLDSSKMNWSRFDPELGYTLGNSMQHNGVGGCWTISTVNANGARTPHVHANKPCRINTYGNSFTECHQVSDDETWQEYLAGHLGEPIRNFGMGGYGVYQAYRRMLRTEQTDLGARYVMLYIFGDDHMRSIMRSRQAVTYAFSPQTTGVFHGNFWSNIEMDLQSKQLVEKKSLLPIRESLYRMSDPDFMYQSLKDDLMVQLNCLAEDRVDPASIDFAPLNALASVLGVAGIDKGNIRSSAARIIQAYGFAATKYIIQKAADFCRSHGKQLMILLLCPGATRQLLRGETRYDQEIVNHLTEQKVRFFDMNLVHLQDYKAFNLSVEDYMKRYFIGHYSPAGNHFFAYSLKNSIVEWLDPKPITYREAGSPPSFFW